MALISSSDQNESFVSTLPLLFPTNFSGSIGRQRKQMTAVKAKFKTCQNAAVIQSASHFSLNASVTLNHISYTTHTNDKTTDKANALVKYRYKLNLAICLLCCNCANVLLKLVKIHKMNAPSN